jgi:hypothetical protein
MSKLVKFRLKNMGKNTVLIHPRLPGGQIPIEHLTDELAARLLNEDGYSRYVERIRTERKSTPKKEKKPRQ